MPRTSRSRHGQTRTLLGRPWWQGVGALVAVVATLIAVLAWRWPFGSADPGGPASNDVSGHDNDCVFQGGSHNNCAVRRASPSPTGDPFVVHTSWPTVRGCDGATSVAVFPGGPRPDGLPVPPGTDPRPRLAAAAGTAAFGDGTLYLDLTVTDDTVVEVEDIRPVFYRDSGARRASWVYAPQGGCGGTYGRWFYLDLDRHTMRDAGVRGDPMFRQEGQPSPPAEPLGPAFHVSRDDPALLAVSSWACAGYHEWGLKVTYVVRDHRYVRVVGGPDGPYRSAGTLAAGAPRYAGGTPLARYGTIRRAVSGRCRASPVSGSAGVRRR